MLEFSCHTLIWKIDWKINIHNVKIWTFRTSSSWENMTHETHMQLYSRQRTIFFAASVMTNVSSMSTYNTYILFLKDRKDAWGKTQPTGIYPSSLFSMTLSKKKWRYEYLHKEEFWMIFRSIFGQSRSSQKKNPLKKSEFFGFLYFLSMNWICEFG